MSGVSWTCFFLLFGSLFIACPPVQFSGATSQFESEEMYDIFINEVFELSGRMIDDPYDRVLFEEIQQFLMPYRLVDPEYTSRLLLDHTNETLYISQHQTGLDRRFPDGRMINFVDWSIGVERFTQLETEALRHKIDGMIWISASMGIVGLLVLWRRAGDSPTARWIGLWLIGGVVEAQLRFAGVLSADLSYQIWHQALSSPVSNILMEVWTLSYVIQQVLVMLNMVSIPLCVVWVYLCWPIQNHYSIGVWKARGIMILRIAGVFMAVNLTTFFAEEMAHCFVYNLTSMSQISVPVSVIVFLALSFIGWLMRRKNRICSEAPSGGLLLLLCFLFSQIVQWLSIVSFDYTIWASQFSFAISVSASLFLICSLLIIVRRTFLRIPAEKDVGFVFLTLILPFVFEVLENLANEILRQTPFFSATGASILGLVMVVFVLGPIWNLIGRVISTLTVRRFGKVQKIVSQYMKEVLELDPQSDYREKALDMFQQLGITDFVFYSKIANEEGYEMTLCGAGNDPADRIRVSKMLRDRLSQVGSFVDVEGILFEWTYFFEQFELRRLRRATGCRYFLPVAIGGCLRGFLGLPDNEQSRELSRFAVAPKLTEFGMSLFLRERA